MCSLWVVSFCGAKRGGNVRLRDAYVCKLDRIIRVYCVSLQLTFVQNFVSIVFAVELAACLAFISKDEAFAAINSE